MLREFEAGRSPGAPSQALSTQSHAAVLAVHIIEQRGTEGHVVKRGVEDALVLLVLCLNCDLTDLRAPPALCVAANAVEVPGGYLRVHVTRGTRGAASGDADLDEDCSPACRSKAQLSGLLW